MTNKVFYQAAAAEVASGAIDNALWIKVNAELPEADDRARQAKYIALRAQELAVGNVKQRATGWWKRLPLWAKIPLGLAAAYIALCIVIAIITTLTAPSY